MKQEPSEQDVEKDRWLLFFSITTPIVCIHFFSIPVALFYIGSLTVLILDKISRTNKDNKDKE